MRGIYDRAISGCRCTFGRASKTADVKIDDAIVVGLRAAIELSAVANEVELPNPDKD